MVTALLRMLLNKAPLLGVDVILLTVDVGNNASKRICETNGGVLDRDDAERWCQIFN